MTLIALVSQVLLTIPLTIILNYFKNKNYSKLNQFLIPIVYIIIISALIPSIKNNVYLIVVFEIFIRNFYITNITLENKENSISFIIDSIISITLSIFAYNYFISNVESVIPDPETIKSIIWFLIIIYILNVYKIKTKDKQVVIAEKKKEYKKENVVMQYAKYKNKYSSIINSKTNTVNNLTYAIMIYESLNTPVFNRKIEEYIGAVSKTETKYGIMRIKSYNHLTDEESIKIVLEKLEQDYKSLKDKKALNTIINSYNDIEKEDILTIYNQIVEFSKK